MPANATIVELKGKQIVRWKDRKGRSRSAELTVSADGAPRIKTTAATYTAKYRDGDGVVREISTGCRDKQAAMSVLKELTDRAELVRAKIISPDQDRVADHQKIPVAKHIEAYIVYQRDRGRNAEHVRNYETRLNRSADGCRFRWLSELNADRLERWLSALTESTPSASKDEGVEDDDTAKLVSASVYNGYIEA